MEKTQREYYLNEQMKAIQRELGESDEGRDDSGRISRRRSRRPSSRRRPATRRSAELKKLKPDVAHVGRGHGGAQLSRLDALDPVGQAQPVKKDLNKAQEVLDDDHYGLEKVKERIVEYLAVQQRARRS